MKHKKHKDNRIMPLSDFRRFCITVAFILFVFITAATHAEDWPTYMHDNSRSGTTSEELDLTKLRQAWVYTSPAPPRTAFSGPAPWDPYRPISPLPASRDFDSALFVTIINDSVYFGSSVTDSLHCMNIYNGRQKWFYRTNGAVRFPPCYYNGKLYFGSDDGCLYCVNAADGSLVWKYSPSGNTRLLCNNGNLIPQWPIRTGTAVYGDKVYFAASLVPWKYPYLCSLDAETGSDSGSGLYKIQQTVFGIPPDSSYSYLTPRGSIIVSSSKIYLSQGRICPFVFSRSNGSFIDTLDKAIGWSDWMRYHNNVGTYALLTDDSSYVHGRGQWHTAGDLLFEDKVVFDSSGTALVVSGSYAYIIERTFDTDPQAGSLLDIHGKVKCILRSNGSIQWSRSNLTYDPYVLIKAGENLFVGGTKKVVAYNSSNGNEVWSKTVTGKVRGLAAANGFLFVSTDTGHIYAFGGIPGDFSGDGAVNLFDFELFIRTFSDCTNPNDDTCNQYP